MSQAPSSPAVLSTADLIDLVDLPMRAKQWHGGPSLCATLRTVDAPTALWKPHPRRHSIWELALHCAYWKHAVRQHLLPNPSDKFPRSPSNWPAVPARQNHAAWQQDRQLIETTHSLLMDAVSSMSPDLLHLKPPRSRRFTRLQLITGIVAHDLYHTGQIQLLKKLAKASQSS